MCEKLLELGAHVKKFEFNHLVVYIHLKLKWVQKLLYLENNLRIELQIKYFDHKNKWTVYRTKVIFINFNE